MGGDEVAEVFTVDGKHVRVGRRGDEGGGDVVGQKPGGKVESKGGGEQWGGAVRRESGEWEGKLDGELGGWDEVSERLISLEDDTVVPVVRGAENEELNDDHQKPKDGGR